MNTRIYAVVAEGAVCFVWRPTMLALILALTCPIASRVRAAQAGSCVTTPPLEAAIYLADLVYLGTVTSTLPGGRVQFQLVEAIKGQIDATPVLEESEGHFVAGHTYVVFAHRRTTENEAPLSYRPPVCGPAAPEIVDDDRRLVDRVREIAREQSRTIERPRVGVYPPKKVKDVAPVWPGQVQVSRNSAAITVILEVRITAAGVVPDARVLRSVPSFDQAAVDAARRWEYLPALINGVAMPATVTETVVFRRP